MENAEGTQREELRRKKSVDVAEEKE